MSYTIAPYGGAGDFTPGEWKALDIGGPNNFYAANSMKAPDGRWLLWGMNLGGGAPGHHWATHLSLPRVLTLRPDGAPLGLRDLNVPGTQANGLGT